jgi:DNA-directed RNA polymerase subunit E'/Rpb7
MAMSGLAVSSSLYSKCLLSRRVTVPFVSLGNGSTVKTILLRHIQEQVENKCTIEGFVHPDTCSLISFSGGTVAGSNVKFDVSFECDVCSPAEGAIIACVVKNVTHAGIRAVIGLKVTPVVVYISRDHHFKDDYFETIQPDAKIMVRVIGQRFELNDKHVSIIGELVKPVAISAAGMVSGAAKTGRITVTGMDDVD